MGQNPSQEVVPESKSDNICEIFNQGVVYASQQLKKYLGFEDPQGKLQVSINTLNEIFLVNFIMFSLEKGVQDRITTSKMTTQQSLLLGVDWIWTIHGSEKSVKLQIAVQTLQMADQNHSEIDQNVVLCSNSEEDKLADQSRSEKLVDFCSRVGEDCVGIFIVFGVRGTPREVRGVLLDSVRNGTIIDHELKQFIAQTDSFICTRELLETCLSKTNRLKSIENAYINFH
ncbi:rab15 effector protein-like [Callorhinchus milii]|uniref:RAB15 effector protein n=1 Tax=Callorhinchus milii TaxID=7868 RepID=A0A4W3J1D3_CALMI|nr:rab15 effector protein-like [Callorhinchus milii]|eukprot:gi/632955716/ref/XP_007893600.1/ PREDICTED: rab15 effector protein-like [Callorhinchus milii]